MRLNTLACSSIVSLFALAACEFGGGAGPAAMLNPDGPSGFTPDAPSTHHDSGSGMKDSKVFMDAPVVKHDAPSTGSDAEMVDAGSGSAGATPHLLLTEICLNPDAAAFVEIYNPTTAAVDLTDYYLSPSGYYWQLPVSLKNNTALPLTSGQWVAQFPAGSTIAAGQVITVAPESAMNFNTTYGVDPTYSVTDGTITDLQDGGSIYLDYSGAPVSLFYWDGVSDIVQDVDMMIAGGSSSSWQFESKSGMTQGSGTYLTDANTIAPQAGTPGANTSTKRITFETGHETQNGTGNGITGHDETSEATSVTWDNAFSAPTPGTIPVL